MKTHPLALDISGISGISGIIAMWTRPDAGDAPVSYPAPTLSAVKGIFESIVWLKSTEVLPTRVEICAPLVTYYGGPFGSIPFRGAIDS